VDDEGDGQREGKSLERIRVLLADDHTLFRKGIRNMLEEMPDVEVVGEAATGREAVEKACALVPDVILLDIKMPEATGIRPRQILRKTRIGIILVTMYDDQSAFTGCARGYV
jgi:DNA-binding NarL/FixJ family response regulator